MGAVNVSGITDTGTEFKGLEHHGVALKTHDECSSWDSCD